MGIVLFGAHVSHRVDMRQLCDTSLLCTPFESIVRCAGGRWGLLDGEDTVLLGCYGSKGQNRLKWWQDRRIVTASDESG